MAPLRDGNGYTGDLPARSGPLVRKSDIFGIYLPRVRAGFLIHVKRPPAAVAGGWAFARRLVRAHEPSGNDVLQRQTCYCLHCLWNSHDTYRQ